MSHLPWFDSSLVDVSKCLMAVPEGYDDSREQLTKAIRKLRKKADKIAKDQRNSTLVRDYNRGKVSMADAVLLMLEEGVPK